MTVSLHPRLRAILDQRLRDCLARYEIQRREVIRSLETALARITSLQETLCDSASAPLLSLLHIECLDILGRLDDLASAPLPEDAQIADLIRRTRRVGALAAGLLPPAQAAGPSPAAPAALAT